MPHNLQEIFPYQLLIKPKLKTKTLGVNLPNMKFLKASYETNYEETQQMLKQRKQIKPLYA